MTTFTIHGYAIDGATLPAASTDAMISRGLSHFLGSEVAAKVGSRAEAWKANATDNPTAAEATVEQKASWGTEIRGAFIDKLNAGTVGVRVAGAGTRTADPVESKLGTIARGEVLATLKKLGIKAPKKATDKATLPDGAQKTIAEMVASRIAHEVHGPRMRKLAEKQVKELSNATAGEDIGL